MGATYCRTTFAFDFGQLADPLLGPSRLPSDPKVDASGKRARLHCVNWYGAHMKQMVMNGLDAAPLEDIAGNVSDLGFNCVRLPYSIEMLSDSAVVPHPRETLAANRDLQGTTGVHLGKLHGLRAPELMLEERLL